MASKRKQASKRMRFEVFKRDGFTCRYCGRRPPEVTLVADHLVPVAQDGPTLIENLITACIECNQGKAAKSLGDVVPPADSDAMLASAQELAEQRAAIAAQIEAQLAIQEAEKEVLGFFLKRWEDIGGQEPSFDPHSIRMMLREASLETIASAFVITDRWWSANEHVNQGKAWKYLCGVAWNLIRGNDRKMADA